MINHKIKSYKFGLFAEFITIIFLKFKGYIIIENRYKNKFGEIDIIARKKNVLIAIEVKARKRICSIEEVVSTKQKKRISRSMNVFYCRKKYYGKFVIRYDLVIIIPYKFPIHIKNYWS